MLGTVEEGFGVIPSISLRVFSCSRLDSPLRAVLSRAREFVATTAFREKDSELSYGPMLARASPRWSTRMTRAEGQKFGRVERLVGWLPRRLEAIDADGTESTQGPIVG